jgi:hypothetical protein
MKQNGWKKTKNERKAKKKIINKRWMKKAWKREDDEHGMKKRRERKGDKKWNKVSKGSKCKK